MISYDNSGDIHITKRDGEQFAIKNINTHQSKKVVGFLKYSSRYD